MARGEWIEVADLGQKFDLLVDNGLVASRKDLAAEWGVRRGTLYEWVRSRDGVHENRMPAGMFERLLEKLEPLLPHLAPAELRVLATGSSRFLADEIARSKSIDHSLTGFLKEAVAEEGRVIKATDDLALVAIASTAINPAVPRVRLGELFRIEFDLRYRCRYAIILQNVGRSWGTVPAIIHEQSQCVLVPGRTASGDHGYIQETAEPGDHAFYCLQAVGPLPGNLQSRLAEPFAIDRGTMSAIARFYAWLSRTDRAVQRIALHVTRD